MVGLRTISEDKAASDNEYGYTLLYISISVWNLNNPQEHLGICLSL